MFETGLGGTAHVLQLSSEALAAFTHDDSDREHLRHSEIANLADHWCQLPECCPAPILVAA